MQRFYFNCNLSFNVFDYPIEIVLTDTNELKAIRSLRFIIWLRVIPCRCSIYKVHFITRDKTRLNYAVVSWQNNEKPRLLQVNDILHFSRHHMHLPDKLLK